MSDDSPPSHEPEKSTDECRHDLSGLLLAARLRIDAIRTASDDEARAEQIEALEECLLKATEIVRDMGLWASSARAPRLGRSPDRPIDPPRQG